MSARICWCGAPDVAHVGKPLCGKHIVLDNEYLHSLLTHMEAECKRAMTPPDGWVVIKDTERIHWNLRQHDFAESRLWPCADVYDFGISYMQEGDYAALKALAERQDGASDREKKSE